MQIEHLPGPNREVGTSKSRFPSQRLAASGIAQKDYAEFGQAVRVSSAQRCTERLHIISAPRNTLLAVLMM
jgi:hypothetical protein